MDRKLYMSGEVCRSIGQQEMGAGGHAETGHAWNLKPQSEGRQHELCTNAWRTSGKIPHVPTWHRFPPLTPGTDEGNQEQKPSSERCGSRAVSVQKADAAHRHLVLSS